MRKIRYLVYLFLLNFLFASCTSVQDVSNVMRNNKTNTTDEFLVKKREPLSQPPDINKMPEPDSEVKKMKKNSIEKIFNTKEKQIKNTSASSTEELILKQIK